MPMNTWTAPEGSVFASFICEGETRLGCTLVTGATEQEAQASLDVLIPTAKVVKIFKEADVTYGKG